MLERAHAQSGAAPFVSGAYGESCRLRGMHQTSAIANCVLDLWGTVRCRTRFFDCLLRRRFHTGASARRVRVHVVARLRAQHLNGPRAWRQVVS